MPSLNTESAQGMSWRHYIMVQDKFCFACKYMKITHTYGMVNCQLEHILKNNYQIEVINMR